jgi:oligopeptide/dipeptide ABC transporter ATP-binding protein
VNETLLALQDVVVLRQTDPRIFGMFGSKPIRALDGISLSLNRGETLGVMGGSGSGKSTLAEVAALRLAPSRGRVLVQGQDPARLSGDDRKKLRRRLQIIRQDARDSLDMEQTVARQFQELLRHAGLPESEARIAGVLEQVGLPSQFLSRTPAEMSGGQQQRLAIARALAVNPVLVAGDEPVSGVDPHLQLEMLRLLEQVQKQQNVSFLMVSHDRRVIGRLAHRVAVLCEGRLCELGSAAEVLTSARHPYSRLFLGQEPGGMPGDEDQAGSASVGCPWVNHCSLAREACKRQMPDLREVAPGHAAACHAL